MLREDLNKLPAYVPGKRQVNALKLSSNEVTGGPLPSVVAAMNDVAVGVNRYPDFGAEEIREVLAGHLGVTQAQVAVGVGSSALCQQLVQITCQPGDEVVFPWRSFEAYPIFTQVVGATPVAVPLDAQLKNDLSAMAAAITPATKLVFVCNPNNPTGTTIGTAAFEEFMSAVPDNVLVALDEAYFEYNDAADTPNAALLVHKYPNLVGLRTFSKAYGLAGLRIGYAFGSEKVIEALNKVALPFGVNSMAQAAALASLAATDELQQRAELLNSERTRVTEALAELGAVPSKANFIWLPGKHLAAPLAEQGILVREFPEGTRITITTAEEMDRLIEACSTLDLTDN